MDLKDLTIEKVSDDLANRRVSSVELTQAYLDHIEKRNDQINAFITLDKENAVEQAKKADKKRKDEDTVSPLCGIPFGMKDSIISKGIRSTAAAKILDTYIPPYDSTVNKKLRSLGAVLLGKQNCDAFGHGASNENSMYGEVKNPHDLTKVAGGSSGGSAASVADDQCLFSIAEDTGGSIRQPASFCGVTGLRPSYGRVSRYGVMPMASSLDTVGPIAKNIKDLALVMESIAGHDKKDATTVTDDVPKYSNFLEKGIKGMKIGIPKEYMNLAGLDSEVKEVIEKLIKDCEKQGAEIVEVSLPHTKYAIAVYYLIVSSEDSSNMARFDGIRYGVCDESAKTLVDLYKKSRSNGFPREVKRRIMLGAYALSAGYYDQYYRRAQKVRTLISQDFEHVFSHVDMLLTPTSPFPAFGIGEKIDDVLAMYLADVYVSPAAIAGIPALSVPVGKSKEGLPIGAQLIGPRLKEEVLLQAGQAIETLE